MYQNIIFTYKGKTSTISKYADGSIAWFTYGVSQQMPVVEDYWPFVLLDQITENIDAYLDDETAAIWETAWWAEYDAHNAKAPWNY